MKFIRWQGEHDSSKFNSPAVSRYHPVEGEAYAAAWALNKCKLFVLGNPDLLLAVDHKPLLAILGNENELNEVLNPRLLNFKLKSMAYKFKPVYVPGKKHVVPDSFSRRHDSPVTTQEQLPKLPPTSSNVLPPYESTFGPPDWVHSPEVSAIEADWELQYIAAASVSLSAVASHAPDAGNSCITWSELSQHCSTCPEYAALLKTIDTAEKSRTCPDTLKEYSKVLPELTHLQGVAMLQNRVVIPKALRPKVLKFLHAAHAGTQAMISRAVTSVYWPNYKADIVATRQACTSCDTFAPSNPPTYPTPDADLPTYPFQVVCTDFFDWNGKKGFF